MEISPTPDPNLNLPDSVNKCKTAVKTHSLIQPCIILTSSYAGLNCFVEPIYSFIYLFILLLCYALTLGLFKMSKFCAKLINGRFEG